MRQVHPMPIFRFERLDKPIAPHRVFFGRLARNVAMALGMVSIALAN